MTWKFDFTSIINEPTLLATANKAKVPKRQSDPAKRCKTKGANWLPPQIELQLEIGPEGTQS